MMSNKKKKRKKMERKRKVSEAMFPYSYQKLPAIYMTKKINIPAEQEINTEDREPGEKEIGRPTVFMSISNVITTAKGWASFFCKSLMVNLFSLCRPYASTQSIAGKHLHKCTHVNKWVGMCSSTTFFNDHSWWDLAHRP